MIGVRRISHAELSADLSGQTQLEYYTDVLGLHR